MSKELALITAALLLSGAALAQSPAQMAIAQACQEDIKTHCAGIQPGGGRIGACMRENVSKLSEGCKKAIQDNRSSLPATQTGQTGAAQPPSGDTGPAQETTPPATQE